MAAIGHRILWHNGGSSGSTTLRLWSSASTGWDTGGGSAAESFYISAMTPSSNGTYIAFDFGAEGDYGSYTDSCLGYYGSWKLNQTISFGGITVTPCERHWPSTTYNLTAALGP